MPASGTWRSAWQALTFAEASWQREARSAEGAYLGTSADYARGVARRTGSSLICVMAVETDGAFVGIGLIALDAVVDFRAGLA
jgi:hypothetical protein